LPEVGSISTVCAEMTPGRLHGVDHGDTDPVLDAGGGIEELELAKMAALTPLQVGQPPQPHDRGVADRLGDGIEYATATGAAGFAALLAGLALVSPRRT